MIVVGRPVRIQAHIDEENEDVKNLSDVSGQRGWLGFPWRTATPLSFLGPECDLEKAKLSSVFFFLFLGKG